MSSQLAFPTSPATPVADLIDRLAAEFRDLAGVARSVQETTGRIGRAGLDEAAILSAQRLDGVTQRLDALATFAVALAAVVPSHWQVDAGPATALLTLSDLQRRLSGLDQHPPEGAEASPGEDFELF